MSTIDMEFLCNQDINFISMIFRNLQNISVVSFLQS